jgi:hypothetical protein
VRKAYLVVTIDTEEDQWGISAEKPTLSNINSLPELQRYFDEENILPTYLISYPVATDDSAVEVLLKILLKGKCEIGAHLHPWNCPPLFEEANEQNTMLANLPYELQLLKIRTITQCINSRFGRKPEVFRAGRWGIGKETIKALIECGYTADTSVTPFTSWECYNGSSFNHASFTPYLLDGQGDVSRPCKKGKTINDKILEVPVTIGYNRWPFEKWQRLHLMLSKFPVYLHANGILHRSHLLRKIWLSPEIDNANNMLILTKIVLENGGKILNMNFHSNSLTLGMGPFVRNKHDLLKFLKNLKTYFKRIREIAEITPVFLSDLREVVLQESV